MKWHFLLSALGALAAASPAAAQANSVGITVLPFEDRGSYGQDKEIFRALELGIPATLAAELSRHPQIRVADRGRVSQALKAQNLGPNARLDATSAARVASEAGARYAVTGNFADFYGKFRIDARIVDAGSGQILKVVSNDDPALQDRAQLSRIIQHLAEKILETAGLEPMRGAQRTVVPTEALTQYSLGLLHEQQGDKTRASEHYQRALAAYPGYKEAREGMQRLR